VNGERKQRMTRWSGLVMALVAAALLLAACGGDAGDDTASPGDAMPSMDHGSMPSPAAERPSTDATLTIVVPSNGDVLDGEAIDVRLELEGARVVDQTSTNLRPDEGHLHVLLDDQLLSMTEGLEQTLHDVPAGQHLLEVEFVANDHAPFDPRVIAKVAFEVRG
jgi:predicted small secreted protein